MYKEQRERSLNKTVKENSKPQGKSSREEERHRGQLWKKPKNKKRAPSTTLEGRGQDQLLGGARQTAPPSFSLTSKEAASEWKPMSFSFWSWLIVAQTQPGRIPAPLQESLSRATREAMCQSAGPVFESLLHFFSVRPVQVTSPLKPSVSSSVTWE